MKLLKRVLVLASLGNAIMTQDDIRFDGFA